MNTQTASRRQRPKAPVQLPCEETIRAVVLGFYARVRADDLIGPIFELRLHDHWDEHLETMVDFWSSILLSSGRYSGRPLAIHGELGEITPAMWSRWLELFRHTAREHASEGAAELFIMRAEQIAGHLSRQLSRRTRPTLELIGA